MLCRAYFASLKVGLDTPFHRACSGIYPFKTLDPMSVVQWPLTIWKQCDCEGTRLMTDSLVSVPCLSTIDGSTDRCCIAIGTNERALLSGSDHPVQKLGRHRILCM